MEEIDSNKSKFCLFQVEEKRAKKFTVRLELHNNKLVVKGESNAGFPVDAACDSIFQTCMPGQHNVHPSSPIQCKLPQNGNPSLKSAYNFTILPSFINKI